MEAWRELGEKNVGVYDHLPGVYWIVCFPERSIYIGQTGRSFHARWMQHIKLLDIGAHTCRALQRDYDKHSGEGFLLCIAQVEEDDWERRKIEREHLEYWRSRPGIRCYNRER